MGGGRTALCWPHIYSDILQNAPFRSQVFQIFFASNGKGALTPLTKILRTLLLLNGGGVQWRVRGIRTPCQETSIFWYVISQCYRPTRKTYSGCANIFVSSAKSKERYRLTHPLSKISSLATGVVHVCNWWWWWQWWQYKLAVLVYRCQLKHYPTTILQGLVP